MTSPVRLRLSRAKGFDLQAHSGNVNGLAAVNVARPSVLGNPFVVGKHGTRAECVGWFIATCDGLAMVSADELTCERSRTYPFVLKAETARLRLKNLACWCALPKPGEPDICHAAVLLGWVNHDDFAARRAALRPICEAVFGPTRGARD